MNIPNEFKDYPREATKDFSRQMAHNEVFAIARTAKGDNFAKAHAIFKKLAFDDKMAVSVDERSYVNYMITSANYWLFLHGMETCRATNGYDEEIAFKSLKK